MWKRLHLIILVLVGTACGISGPDQTSGDHDVTGTGGKADEYAAALAGTYGVLARLDEERQDVGYSSTRFWAMASIAGSDVGEEGGEVEVTFEPCFVQQRVGVNVREAVGRLAAITVETLTGRDPSNLEFAAVPYQEGYAGLLRPVTVRGRLSSVDGTFALETESTIIRLSQNDSGRTLDDDGDGEPGVSFWVDGPGPANAYADVVGEFGFRVVVSGSQDKMLETNQSAEDWNLSLELLSATAPGLDILDYADAFWNRPVVASSKAIRLQRLTDSALNQGSCMNILAYDGLGLDAEP